MLAECMASVRAQTLQPIEHLVGIDYARVGTSENTNRLALAARGEWYALLADDDLFLPEHLEKLSAADGDIVYSEPRVEGESWARVGEPDILGGGGTPPSTCLIRADVWHELGGYRGGRFTTGIPEDMDFWKRAAQAGKKIVYVPDATWVYRFWKKPDGKPGNQSRR